MNSNTYQCAVSRRKSVELLHYLAMVIEEVRGAGEASCSVGIINAFCDAKTERCGSVVVRDGLRVQQRHENDHALHRQVLLEEPALFVDDF